MVDGLLPSAANVLLESDLSVQVCNGTLFFSLVWSHLIGFPLNGIDHPQSEYSSCLSLKRYFIVESFRGPRRQRDAQEPSSTVGTPFFGMFTPVEGLTADLIASHPSLVALSIAELR